MFQKIHLKGKSRVHIVEIEIEIENQICDDELENNPLYSQMLDAKIIDSNETNRVL